MNILDRYAAVDRVQLALRQCGETYKPSPGQTPDHVHHRVAELAVAELWGDVELLIIKRDELIKELIKMQHELRDMVRRLEVVTHEPDTPLR